MLAKFFYAALKHMLAVALNVCLQTDVANRCFSETNVSLKLAPAETDVFLMYL